MSKYLTKIQALLAKAESTDSPEEAKALSAKAQELMEKWGIEEADLVAQGKARSDEIIHETIWIPGVQERAWKVQFWHNVALLNGCQGLMITGGKWNAERGKVDKGVHYKYIGYEHDVRMVEMLVSSLMIQADREYRSDKIQDQARSECRHPAHWIKWKNAFMMGYASAVHVRLKEARDRTRKDNVTPGSSTDLVLIDRSQKVNQAFDEAHPHRKNAYTDAGPHRNARNEGYLAGNRADIGQNNVGSGRRGELL